LQARPYVATLRGVESLSPIVRLLRFEIDGGGPLDFVPGQFVTLRIPLPELGQDNGRSYSLASSPDGSGLFEIAITRVRGGPGSTWLHGIEPGTQVQMSGPHGFFTLADSRPSATCFVATGTGVTPIRPMLRRVFEAGGEPETHLVFGVRHEADLIWRAEFEALARAHPAFRFHPTLTSPPTTWNGHVGRVQALVDRLLIEPRRTDVDVYVCGLRRMVDDVRDRLKTAGWNKKKLHQERYD